MTIEKNPEQPIAEPKTRWNFNLIPTILIAAWIIGMSIIGAGWMITKEISKQNNPDANTPAKNQRVDIKIPENQSAEGAEDAKVTIIEFADFQCPFCGEWQKEVYPKLKSEYIDTNKVKFVFWDFPFLGDESFKAAEAAQCAKDQGKFWEYHDKLYASQNGENEGAFSDPNLKKFATELKLDTKAFNQCFDTRVHKDYINNSADLGYQYGIESTPTIFINGLKFPGVMPYENYKQVIESELAK